MDITINANQNFTSVKHAYKDTGTEVIIIGVYRGEPFDKNGRHLSKNKVCSIAMGGDTVNRFLETLKGAKQLPISKWEK